MKYATCIGSSIVAIALAGAAFADSPQDVSKGSVSFTGYDVNHDGRLSSAEVKSNAPLEAAFAKLDVNHDGYLTPAEFSKWRNPNGAASGPMTPDSSKTPADSSK